MLTKDGNNLSGQIKKVKQLRIVVSTSSGKLLNYTDNKILAML